MATPGENSSALAKVLPGQFPEPVIVSPQLEHRHTFIILHGRGSKAKKFGPPLLDMATSSDEKLQTAFPHAKIIFLTASRNRATIYKRSYTHQWFDGWHMEDRTKRQDLIRDGLHKSCKYVHGILHREIGLVGRKNVVLWGMSQGCATSLFTLLIWDGEPFAATVGMCGYMPFANHIQDIERFADDPFSQEEDDSSEKQDRPTQAISFLRKEIDMGDKAGMVFRSIPVFLGHGTEDEKVAIEIGREAKDCLDFLEANVRMVEYEGLGHWYSDEMLGDIFDFLRERLCTEDT